MKGVVFVKAVPMALEEEMRNEIRKLEAEISVIDVEIDKLHTKLANLMNIRKKKEHDLRILKETFEEELEDESSMQAALRTMRMMKNL